MDNRIHNTNKRRRNGLTARIVKALGLFGSSEALTMLCSVVRNKLMAIWVGAAGVGVLAMLNVAMEMISNLAQMGMRVSSVQQLSQAADDRAKTARLVAAVRRVGLVLAIGGGLATMVLSPLLSYITFGSLTYAWSFVALGIAVFLTTWRAIETGILQGRGLLRRIASVSIIGVPVSLLLSAPLIYVFRLDSMLPVLLVYAGVLAFMVWVFRAPANRRAEDAMSLREAFGHTRQMLSTGGMIMLSSVATWAAGYVIMSVINRLGGEQDMGFYQVGYTLTINYVGTAFVALGMEYYPRISAAAAAGLRRVEVMMRHQVKVVLMLTLPMSIAMVLLVKWLIELLYSAEFMVSAPLVILAAPGVVLRGVSWCMGFVILAKGNGRMYLLTELVSCALSIALAVSGYAMLGLTGVGIGFTLWYLLYTLVVMGVVHRCYGIGLKPAGLIAVVVSTLLVGAVSAIFIQVQG